MKSKKKRYFVHREGFKNLLDRLEKEFIGDVESKTDFNYTLYTDYTTCKIAPQVLLRAVQTLKTNILERGKENSEGLFEIPLTFLSFCSGVLDVSANSEKLGLMVAFEIKAAAAFIVDLFIRETIFDHTRQSENIFVYRFK